MKNGGKAIFKETRIANFTESIKCINPQIQKSKASQAGYIKGTHIQTNSMSKEHQRGKSMKVAKMKEHIQRDDRITEFSTKTEARKQRIESTTC